MSPSQAGLQLFLPRSPSVWFGDWNLRGKGGGLRRTPTLPAAHSHCLFQSSSFSSITDSTMSLNIITVTLNMGESAEHGPVPLLGRRKGFLGNTAHIFWGLGWDLSGRVQGPGFHIENRKNYICSLFSCHFYKYWYAM